MTLIDQTVTDLLAIDGAIGAAVVDTDSGMALAYGGSPGFDLNLAAAGNSNVVRAKLITMRDLGQEGALEDIMISLDDQYHLIHVLSANEANDLFLYLALDRGRANLALARHKLRVIAKQVSL